MAVIICRRLFLVLSIVYAAGFAAGSNWIPGSILAFVDLNADRFTDLIVKSDSNSITAYLANPKTPTFAEAPSFHLTFPTEVVNVGVGDFDGDSFPDLVVTLRSTVKPEPSCRHYTLWICYGSTSRFECKNLSNITDSDRPITTVCEQPLVFDYDVDQKNDLLSTMIGNSSAAQEIGFVAIRYTENRRFAAVLDVFYMKNHRPHSPPSSHAIVDVTGDLNPELILWMQQGDDTNEDERLIGLTVLQLTDNKEWKADLEVMPGPPKPDAPTLLKSSDKQQFILGRSLYDDFNKDGFVNHLLPVCRKNSDDQCDSLTFLLFMSDGWMTVDIPLVDDHGQKWQVAFDIDESDKTGVSFNVNSGDYTQDGYPDLLVVLKRKDDTLGWIRRAFIFQNSDCAAGQYCGKWKRTFRVWWSPLGSATDVGRATFFDLNEDGTLDVLLERLNSSSGAGGDVWLEFVTSAFEGDTTFLKVEVYTGTCLYDCQNGKEGSTLSLPGATLFYTSTDGDGRPISGSYTQRSVSSYRSLLLPYTIFGLSRTPNFVEKLQVGIPSWPHMNASWQQLVPNSRLYVVPYPPDQPKRWLHRLYVTPGRLIIYSVVSLSSICGLIILIVFALHMNERRLDKKERELQRKRFHFDAM